MGSIFHLLKQNEARVENGIVYLEAKSIGFLCPTVIEGEGDGGQKFISGPTGTAVMTNPTPEHIWQALVNTGSIIFGLPGEIQTCLTHLQSARSSRTVAYLCTITQSCAALLGAIERLSKSKIIIVGCGGIGSQTAFNLAGSGIRTLKIVDADLIEESNLNRQLFWTRNDIGKRKIDVLQRELHLRFLDIQCNPRFLQIGEEDVEAEVAGYDFVVLTADEPIGVAKKELEAMAMHGKIKLISSSYCQSRLSLAYTNQKTPIHKIKDIAWKRNPWFVGPSFAPSNTELAGLISSLIVHEIIAPINDSISPQSAFIDMWKAPHFPRRSA